MFNPCGVNTAKLLQCVWPFYNIMHERVKNVMALMRYFYKNSKDKNQKSSVRKDILVTSQT